MVIPETVLRTLMISETVEPELQDFQRDFIIFRKKNDFWEDLLGKRHDSDQSIKDVSVLRHEDDDYIQQLKLALVPHRHSVESKSVSCPENLR